VGLAGRISVRHLLAADRRGIWRAFDHDTAHIIENFAAVALWLPPGVESDEATFGELIAESCQITPFGCCTGGHAGDRVTAHISSGRENGRIDLAGREAFGRGAQPWGSPTRWSSWPANYVSCLAGEVISVSGQHP
jgi:hypothetical protein